MKEALVDSSEPSSLPSHKTLLLFQFEAILVLPLIEICFKL